MVQSCRLLVRSGFDSVRMLEDEEWLSQSQVVRNGNGSVSSVEGE